MEEAETVEGGDPIRELSKATRREDVGALDRVEADLARGQLKAPSHLTLAWG